MSKRTIDVVDRLSAGAEPGTSGEPTLDQLRVLIAVADAGSFSAAAAALNRSQSVISYAVANLEAQLGLVLFDRAARRPVLTEAGRAVLADAQRVARAVDELRARAGGLTQGLEASVSLVVDVLFPTASIVAMLEEFAKLFPTVALRLRVEALGAVTQLVLDRECGLGISGSLGPRTDVLERREIRGVRLVAVAAPGHALAAARGPIDAERLRRETQLVLSDRSRLTEGQDFGVASLHTWRLGDLGAKHALLRAGLGWGSMPFEAVREDLAAGRLKRLELRDAAEPIYRLLLIHRRDKPPGPAAQWLADRIAAGTHAPEEDIATRSGRA